MLRFKIGILDRFRAWNRRRISEVRLRRDPIATPFGFKMNGLPSMQSGTFEPEETALVRTLLNRSNRFINIGANTGYYCLFAQQLGVETVALEPVPQNVAMLIRNLQANGWSEKICVLPIAAGPQAGFAEIYGVGTGSSLLPGWANNPKSLKQTVTIARLDEVVRPISAQDVTFILMDVEGFEFPALQGSRGLIKATPKPVWMIEIVPQGAGTAKSENTQATFDMMIEAGYAAYAAEGSLLSATGPISGVTNYMFIDNNLNPNTVLGPKESRVKVYSA